MRQETKIITYYKYNELSDISKQNAASKLYDINIHYDWWEHISEDLKTIDCELLGFDTERGSYCEIKMHNPTDVIESIFKHHGSSCETYKLAKQYESKILDSDGDIEENEAFNFKKELEEEYLSMLKRELEYLTSEEAIIESIESNDYEFNEEGELI